ncbi:MAG: pantoate--beta-alanine ligase [Gemmatimonadota bacterium]
MPGRQPEVFGDLPVLRTVREMRGLSRRLRDGGSSLALVPTMGSLHEGHLSLIDRARSLADHVCVSIFVNPSQFGPGEDFSRYPRDLSADIELAGARGADYVFAPEEHEMYPSPQRIWVDPGPLAGTLCGASRPGHFRGVLTVVLKLFQIVEPSAAVFGRKDFQQSVLIRAMCRDLALPVEIDVAPVVREADGLALSSRNVYLSPEQRVQALALAGGLRAACASFAGGETDALRLKQAASGVLETAGLTPEYVAVVDPETLNEDAEAGARSVCAVAAVVGSTRLIDNTPLGGTADL